MSTEKRLIFPRPDLVTPLSASGPAGDGLTTVGQDSERFVRNCFEQDAAKGFELLYREHFSPLCSHAVRVVYSKEMAMDIVSDVFCMFWQQQIHTRITTSYRAYLYTAVRHRSLKYIQREFGRENSFADSADVDVCSDTQTPEEILQYDELSRKVEQVINGLSPQTQKVFLMSRFESKKYQTIADELHLSIKTIETHMSKALSILRRALTDESVLLVFCLLGILSTH